MIQIDKTGYAAETYGTLSRFSSYHTQIQELLRTNPSSILEIGVGDAVTSQYVRRQIGITYTTVDFAADLHPDIVADVRKLTVPDGAYDTVCAFEVLEHIPFEDFEMALGELVRAAKNYVVISLPHFGPPVKLLFKIPFLPEIKVAFKIPFPKTHRFNGQHYWEIGKRGYPVSRILRIMHTFATVERHFVPFENQYHHFFVLKK